ncbi:hypothetical protein [Metasolibacillus sp.]|uniref:hypothetical protein n=1 Tax=Metasolibacillus sp. TaxID=2703680 RepID=UPI0025D42DB2|nr:hypothetical protein [Metasolibacillus sp.]MCT6926152.1 hypothetical protein [Metasolibacillus sp.]MCT6942415.1 hypothetical protein [Metasolibacillus sp.]
MCLYGTYKWVDVLYPREKRVVVDACIADEIQMLNEKGVQTIGSCCSHGRAGQITEYKNGFGFWKEREYPPHVLIMKESIDLAMQLGYRPYPYLYADGTDDGVLIMPLKSGCLTEVDCKEWHELNKVPYKKYFGKIN